ncbi:hypothetical protein GCM10010307_01550 [Streptomyces vastus]|uniref:Nucleotidyl transferase AbiEii/AbiGii toxin family protein n=1 Tax=Streptomyces vastus TaxID=285451 RepID=A0ABP6CK74_9ACTN
MPELHARLLADVIALGSPYPLVLTGGYAVRAHRLVNRPSQDLDVATENPAPMADIAATLRAGLEARGWKVHALETAPLSARFTVADPATGQECEVDILKEIFWRPVAQSPYGPVLAEEDVIGTKVRALADRGAPRDLIDVFAASHRWTRAFCGDPVDNLAEERAGAHGGVDNRHLLVREALHAAQAGAQDGVGEADHLLTRRGGV